MQEKNCHKQNPHHRAMLTCLCESSPVTLPNAMLFAGSDILRGPRTTFSLALHFFWLTSHSWPVWLLHSPWGRAANPAQYGLAISTLCPGTSWGCQVWLACGAARSETLSSSPSCSAHLRSDPPAPCAHYQLCHFPAGSISVWPMAPCPFSEAMQFSSAPISLLLLLYQCHFY